MLKVIKNTGGPLKPLGAKNQLIAKMAFLHGETARIRHSFEVLGYDNSLPSCDAWNSRLLARLAGAGGGPLLVPDPNPLALDEIIDNLKGLADVYAETGNVARRAMAPSAAWVCELNRAEMLDMAYVLTRDKESAKVKKPVKART